VHTEQEIVPGELKKLADWWVEKFQGSRKAHKVGFVDKGLEAQILSTDLRAMALEEVRDQARRDICTAFRVPMVLVGDLDAANFATAHEARLSLMEEVILPRADYYADVINSELVQALDPEVTFEFATDELTILQEEKDKKAARLSTMLRDKVITVEYYREEMGIPETAGPTTEEIAAEKKIEQDAQGDLGKWQRKAMNRMKAGKSAEVDFESDVLPPAIKAAVLGQLAAAATEADVSAVFARALRNGC